MATVEIPYPDDQRQQRAQQDSIGKQHTHNISSCRMAMVLKTPISQPVKHRSPPLPKIIEHKTPERKPMQMPACGSRNGPDSKTSASKALAKFSVLSARTDTPFVKTARAVEICGDVIRASPDGKLDLLGPLSELSDRKRTLTRKFLP